LITINGRESNIAFVRLFGSFSGFQPSLNKSECVCSLNLGILVVNLIESAPF